jgi:hypothetical protein
MILELLGRLYGRAAGVRVDYSRAAALSPSERLRAQSKTRRKILIASLPGQSRLGCTHVLPRRAAGEAEQGRLLTATGQVRLRVGHTQHQQRN